MAKKKKLNKTERRETRLQKTRQWILTYTGSHIVRAYRERFNVDYSCALKDLEEIGALQPERLALLQHHEQIRLDKKREEREPKREQEIYDRFPDSDDRFMFIAGYTSGGAPYGVTWDEMGLEPYQSLEDIPIRKEPTKSRPQKLLLFTELEDNEKAEVTERLADLIDSFFMGADYLPDDENRDEILKELCDNISDVLNPWKPELYCAAYSDPLVDDIEDEEDDEEPEPLRLLIPDNALKIVFDGIVTEIVAAFKADGIELPTFMETLLITETERLTIRRFYKNDLTALCSIMSKPEVMYAWEAGFHKREVRKWLNQQYTRYHKDGYGYFAITLKDSGKLIGQAGLIKLDLNDEKVVEIGYIFDNRYWGQGYAVEAARACADLAFGRFRQNKLFATIRPENTASVKLALKLGMRKIGEIVKTYKDKDMPHDIYLLEKI